MNFPHISASVNAFTLSDKRSAFSVAALVLGTFVFVGVLEAVHLPAAVLLGAMLAAIAVAYYEGRATLPQWSFIAAQGFVGCLIARGVSGDIVQTMWREWPIFFVGIGAVIFFGMMLGIVLTRMKVLPGTTAIWGSAPGAATVMMLMAEAFGGDVRLVAFMQYLRVVFVAIAASLVSRLWVHASNVAVPAIVWFPAIAVPDFIGTCAVAFGGAWLGTRLKLPAGALLVPLFVGVAVSCMHLVTIELPPWLLIVCYSIVGWTIGLRFTRAIVQYAARTFTRVSASILMLLALCGGLAYVLHVALGIDPLTAYLATSPGGADSVAIIAASSKVDVPFVMAMQTSRFLIVLLIGPPLARFVGSRFGKTAVA